MDKRIWFGLYQACGNKGSVGHMSVLVGGLDQGLEVWGGVMSE